MNKQTIKDNLNDVGINYNNDKIAFGKFVCKFCGYVSYQTASFKINPDYKDLPCPECLEKGCNPVNLFHEGMLYENF